MEGKVSVELTSLTAEQVWPLLADFCNLHKWFPFDTGYLVEGIPGQPGLIRYCANTKKTKSGDDQEETTITKWAYEKLLTFDPTQRCLSYELLENNLGFTSYVATVNVFPIEHGCRVEWFITCDPLEVKRWEGWMSYAESCLQYMKKKMEHDLLPIEN
ncbi:lachrymatory-factor synthase-like [Quillaja saponaria]|uniref:Lachrymatory-factor synthase-like n=1 Tax=Quillaja saponaria TaxID=32244 RepID=A0AAD7PNK8_QUISA|nr:lachrymatory-factor synthase-like [Quillaja saponaria]